MEGGVEEEEGEAVDPALPLLVRSGGLRLRALRHSSDLAPTASGEWRPCNWSVY